MRITHPKSTAKPLRTNIFENFRDEGKLFMMSKALRDWTHEEHQHSNVTETHLRIGEGGKGWGEETKPDVIKRLEDGRRETKKRFIRKEQNACS